MSSKKSNSSVEKYHFLLYIDSSKPKSNSTADRLAKICCDNLIEAYTLELVDLQDNPVQFEQQNIIAVPTLVIETPEHSRHRFVGDLSQSEIFIIAIGFAQEASKMSKQASDMRNKIEPLR
ncbi:MAG: circadian clock KaiB family protein [Candidatus Thiodiazotropha sp. 6PLUC2]